MQESMSFSDKRRFWCFLSLALLECLRFDHALAGVQRYRSSCVAYYTVQPGDTCFNIWITEGVLESDFYTLNAGVDCSALMVGQKLCIEGPPDHSTCSKLYAAKQGDSCASIARTARLSLAALRKINPRLNCSSLQVGREVCVAPCSKYVPRAPAKSTRSQYAEKNRILVDYIGAIGYIRLEDVPVREDLDQFFILAFAIDANSSGIPQNGNFSKFWMSSITPESVAALKSKHPNVRVLLSLAGYSIYVPSTQLTETVNWTDPSDPNVWLSNAVDSIGSLVKQYHLDGIDIDYETFPESKTFSKLIGKLIKVLKKEKAISLATMAPYESVLPYYTKLYRQHEKLFDYVNYQFYANNFSTVSEYVQAYDKISGIFPRTKLLASLEVGPTARGPPADIFFEAFSEILREPGSSPGMFLWAADHSKSLGFLVEKVAQCIL